MSSPYGPPPGSGQQGPGQQGPGQQGPGQQGPGQQGPGQYGPGQYGAPGGPSWGAPQQGGQGGPTYGAPAASPYGQAPAQPGQGGPGQGGPGQGGPGQWGGPPPKVKTPPDLARILPLAVLGLGVVAFICGFLKFSGYSSPGGPSISVTVFGGGPAYLPILLLLAGFLAYAPLLPGGREYLLPAALLSVAGLLGAIGALSTDGVLNKFAAAGAITDTASTGIGIIALLVVAILQAAAAGYAWFLSTGAARSVKAPNASAQAFGPGSGSSGAGNAPGHPSAPQAAAGFGGYAAGAYSPTSGVAPGQHPDAPSYSGYGGGSYAPPAGQGNTGYGPGPYPQSSPDPQGPGPGSPASGTQGQTGAGTGQHGRDDGPPPDVTQQVRF